MRKVALLYNPDSGGRGEKRFKKLELALAVIRDAGVEADLVPTESRDEAGKLAQHAIDSGCDTIFACGGDGTIHNIAQVLANSNVALAVLPMGTANALAHDVGIPLDLTGAAKAALQGAPRRIALGHIEYVDLQGRPGTRYFVITAGAGADAHLFYKLLTGAKQRMGMAAYYAKAWNLWMTYPMTRFLAEYLETGSEQSRVAAVTELMCVRIRNFGGVLQEFVPEASLERDDLRAVFCRTSSRLAYLAYVTRGMLRRRWKIPGIDLAHCARISCTYQSPASEQPRKIYIETDGELIGTLPATITAAPNALTLLVPRQ